MTTQDRRVPIDSQAVDAPLTTAAVFLTLTLTGGATAAATARAVLGDVADVVKSVAFRDLSASFACSVGVGSAGWSEIMGTARPGELHPFVPVVGASHIAVSSPGDLFFHIRANRQDLCFEFERQILDHFGGAVEVVDETVGFRYFDSRDLLGFVDGTANPGGGAVAPATLVGEEDPAASGGSYLVAQKYIHDLPAWRALTTEDQEVIMGRSKADNIELPDPIVSQKSHKTLTTIRDEDGEHDILRDNMPFGSPAAREFGTYFIGYSSRLWVIERMLRRMFIGDPPGTHDRLLDFSTPVTGGVYFVPPAAALSALSE